MKKDESNKDRLMDELLRENAKGGDDEQLLADLEKAMGNTAAEGSVAKTPLAIPWFLKVAGVAAGVCLALILTQNLGRDIEDAERDEGAIVVRSAEKYPAPDDAQEVDLSNRGAELRKEKPGKERLANHGSGSPAPGKNSGQLPPLAQLDPAHAPIGLPANEDPGEGALGSLKLNPSADESPAPLRKPNEEFRRKGSERKFLLSQFPAGPRGRPMPQPDVQPLPGKPIEPRGNSERYGQLVDQPWFSPWETALSTFSVDVDTASYSNIRRMLTSGLTVPKDAVRTEECINYFNYRYPAPREDSPFAAHVEMASCPWEGKHHLVKIGLKGKEVDTNNRPASNLVFLIDVSGSMSSPDKLPLLVESMKVLVEELDERDSVGIVVYAGRAGTILNPTKVVGDGRAEILRALEQLRAGGSTAGAAGLRGAYELAAKHYRAEGVNRVILASDGDFNVGTSSNRELVDLVKEKAKSDVFLTVLGFGTGNLNDSMMEAISNDGNGNYFYIDSQKEGRRIFLERLSGTLVTIAKDVKIQVEFNPGKVAGYRLIGYANRILPPEAFNDDKVDAGDIGAGHTVTALYEIVPAGVEVPVNNKVDGLKYQRPAEREVVESPEWMTVKLRYKAPSGTESTKLEVPVVGQPGDWTKATEDFQFAAAAALFGEKLRGSKMIGKATWELVNDLAKRGSKEDLHGHRAEFLELVELASKGRPEQQPPIEPDPVPLPAPVPPVLESGRLDAPKAE